MAVPKLKTNEHLRRNEEKWTAPLMNAGWTVIPSIILEKQHALGLDPIDVNIILHLARYWWYSENLPHPSKSTIAECMAVNPSTVRKHIARMEKDGLIQRVKRYDPKHRGQSSNFYEFTTLIKAATPFALEAIETREERRAEDVARQSRKKPKPKLVINNKPAIKPRGVK